MAKKKPSRSSLVEQICDVKKTSKGNWFENLSEDDKLLCLEVREFCHENNRNRAAVARNLRASIDTDVGTKSIIISTGEFYDDCRIQGTVRAGKCFVTHGTRHGKNAAQQMLSRFNACVVFGHVHKLLSASDRNVKDGEIGAWSVGHLGQQQPCWRHGDPTDWSQGYGFQIVQPSGDFLHINVPIIEGRSYLYTLGKLLN